MLKLLKRLLGFKDSSDIGGLGMELRELIKGKEIDPQQLIELQAEINKMEAQHRTIFVAGWRPFIGWVCGVALAYNFVLRDMLVWQMGAETAPPALQMEHLMTVLIGMLGLGGMRTFEKLKDKTNQWRKKYLFLIQKNQRKKDLEGIVKTPLEVNQVIKRNIEDKVESINY